MYIRSPGSFCWCDVKTYDIPGTAAAFAAELGWRTAAPQRLRATAILTCDEHPVASLSDLANPIYPPETPEHIAWYLTVDDVDARTHTALTTGATCVVEPFELPGLGAMSTIIDPAGAPVSLWEPRGFSGWTHQPGTPRTPGEPRHHGPEPVAARTFYHALGVEVSDSTFTLDRTRATWIGQSTGDMPQRVRTPAGTTVLAD